MKNLKVKTTVIITLILIMIQPLYAGTSVLKPRLHNKKVKIRSGEKKSTSYYTLSKNYATQINIDGPGEITLYLRSGMQDGELADNAYRIKYILDGKIVKVKPVKSSKTSKVDGTNYKVTVARKIKIIIPPGKHKLEVFSYGGDRKVYSKYYFQAYPKPKWSELKPLNKSTVVKLTTEDKKKVVSYHRIDENKTVKILATDKTYLRILLR